MKLILFFLFITFEAMSQKDTVIYNVKYRDTVIYLKCYIYIDTVMDKPTTVSKISKDTKNSNWGIGPTFGAYYSPYNGFDINIGFGVQYYMFNILTRNRNPHMGRKRERK